jgi:hypothetical protein
MALYHVSLKVFTRSRGESATAAAAYRSGLRITDERTGEVHDYTRRKGVEGVALFVPANAPAWALDPAELFNAAEAAEVRGRNGRVARGVGGRRVPMAGRPLRGSGDGGHARARRQGRWTKPSLPHLEKLAKFFGPGPGAALIERILHEYSHLGGGFERALLTLDVMEMRSSAKAIVDRIAEVDLLQFEAFKKAIGV